MRKSLFKKQPAPRRRTSRFLITGLATLLPVLLTIYLISFPLMAIHKIVDSGITKINENNDLFHIPEAMWTTILGDAILFVLFLAIVWLAGFLFATYLGRSLFRWLDRVYRRIPLFRLVYPAVKQVTDFFFSKQNVRFRRVIAIEYPRKGIYALGFLTGDGLPDIKSVDGEQLATVFIPSSPAPFTGYTIFVRRSELIPLNLTIERAIKLVVSGGVVVPEAELRELSGEAGEELEATSEPAASEQKPALPEQTNPPLEG